MKLETDQNKIPPIKMVWKKMTGVKWGEQILVTPSTPENITDDAVPETFIHLSQKTENMIPCYLKSELSILNHKDLYFDGTFSLVRNLDYNQIYIISIVYSNGGSGVLSYPVMFFLMKKRAKNDYIEILNFVKKLYIDEFGTELDNKYFHSDAELSFMLAIPLVFPESSTILWSTTYSNVLTPMI